MTDIVTKPFNVTLNDYNGLFITASFRALFSLPVGLVYLYQLLFWPFMFVNYDVNAESWPKFAAGVAVMAVLWLVVIPFFSILVARNGLKKAQNTTGTRTARLTDDFLALDGDGFTNRMVWKTFRYATCNRQAIYFVTRLNAGYIVLNSAFESPDQRAQFLKTAQQFIRAAKAKPAVILGDDGAPTYDEATALVSQPFSLNIWRSVATYTHNLYQMFLSPLTALATIVFLGAVFALMRYQHDDLRLESPADWLSVVWQPVTFYVFFCFVFVPLLTPLTWLIHRNSPHFKGKRRVAIDGQRICILAQSNTFSVEWQDIEKVTRRFGYILIFPKPRGTLIVPISAFADKASAQAFYDQARAWWRASRQDKTSASQ